MLDKYQEEFHSHCVWNPSERGVNPHKAIDVDEARKVAVRYLKDEGQDAAADVIEKFWFGDVVLLMAGFLPLSDLASHIVSTNTIDKRKLSFYFGEDKTTFDKWREAQQHLTNLYS